jgi:radical SAM protein with 4Fe4S-binding SPASM domain
MSDAQHAPPSLSGGMAGNPRDALRALEKRYADQGRLFLVHLDLTWRCPLSCPHCYLGERKSPELDTGAWLDLLDQARALEVAQVVLSGGEPMARKDFGILLEAARARGFAVLVKTTGLWLTAADADRFAALRWVLVDISLHSATAAIHDAFVGRDGAWAEAVRAVDALLARGVSVRIARSVVEGLEDDGGALWDWAHARGMRIIESTSVVPRRDGLPAGRASMSEAAQVGVVLRHMAHRPAPAPRVPDPAAPPCAAGHTRLYVTPAGEINPCVAWPRRLGHLLEGGLPAVLASDALARLRALRQGDRHQCSDCELRPTCDFCPGQAEILTGSPDAPYPAACSRARVLGEALRRLREGAGEGR